MPEFFGDDKDSLVGGLPTEGDIIFARYIGPAKEMMLQGNKEGARESALEGIDAAGKTVVSRGVRPWKELATLWGIAAAAGALSSDEKKLFEDYLGRLSKKDQRDVRKFLAELKKKPSRR